MHIAEAWNDWCLGSRSVHLVDSKRHNVVIRGRWSDVGDEGKLLALDADDVVFNDEIVILLVTFTVFTLNLSSRTALNLYSMKGLVFLERTRMSCLARWESRSRSLACF